MAQIVRTFVIALVSDKGVIHRKYYTFAQPIAEQLVVCSGLKLSDFPSFLPFS